MHENFSRYRLSKFILWRHSGQKAVFPIYILYKEEDLRPCNYQLILPHIMKFDTRYNSGMLNSKLKSNFENSRRLLFYCPFFCSSVNDPLFWINLLKRRQIRYKSVQETICVCWVQKWCQTFEIIKTDCSIVYFIVLLLAIHCFNRSVRTPPN